MLCLPESVHFAREAPTSNVAGISSLQKSGNHAARENARTKSGDWHYTMRCDTDWFEEFEKTYQPGEKEQGYCVEKTGVLTMRKVTEEPYEIELDYADIRKKHHIPPAR